MTTTRGSRLVVGGSDWCVDLADSATGFALSPTVNTAGKPAVGRKFVDKVLAGAKRQIDVTALYTEDDAVKTFAGYHTGIAFATAGTAWAEGGPAIWTGLDDSGPSDDILSSTVSLMPSDVWLYSTKITEFALTASTQTVPLSTVGNGEHLYVAVTSGPAADTLRITDSAGTPAHTPVEGNGTRLVRVTPSAAFEGIVSINLQAALTGSNIVAGLVIIASEVEIG